MTVSSQQSEITSAGDGVTTLFPVPFYFLEQTDLVVTRLNADLTTTLLALGSNYSVSGAGNQAGGSITVFVSPAIGTQLKISRVVPVTQETDYVANDPFPAESHERALDKLTMICQQALAIANNSIQLIAQGWDFRGRRGVNAADPIDDQDVTTKHWSREYITALISAIQGPINNALNIFYKGPDNLNYVVQDMSSTTDAAKGGSLIGWFQAGAGAIGRTVTAKLREWISIGDYGGVDDNSTDNTAALNSAKTFVGAGGTFRLIRRVGGVFKFTNVFNLNGPIINNDPGLTVSATESLLNISGTSPANVLRRLRLYFSNINFQYFLYPEHSEDLAEKRVWLDESDYDLSYRENFDLTTLASMRHEMLSWPAGDTWSAASTMALGNNGADYPYIAWGAGTANTWYRSSFPVRVGDDVCASFDTPGVFNRAVFVQHAGGYLALYATGIAGNLRYVRKDLGVAPVENDVGVGDIFRTQIQYYGENSVWRVKILTKRQFVILLNGQQVGGVLTSPFDITRAGFGYMPQTVTAIAVSGFVRTRNNRAGGRAPEGITIYGDSISADIHGGWPYFMRRALEGSAGVVVASITNLAVPGYTTANMWADMQVKGFNGGTALICGGTNDGQGQVGVPTMLANVRNMITFARNNSQTPIVWIPPLWYTQAEAQAAGAPAGTGQASANAFACANYRTNLERLCATMAVKCVDMTQVTGPIDAAYLVPGAGVIADAGMRDNIHPTAYMYKKLGMAMAKAIMGERSGGIKRRREIQPLGITYSSPWTAFSVPAEQAQGFLADDGMMTPFGKIASPSSGIPTTKVSIAQLREDLWPVVPVKQPVSHSAGNCTGYIDTNGIISVENYPSGSTWVDLSGFGPYLTAQ